MSRDPAKKAVAWRLKASVKIGKSQAEFFPEETDANKRCSSDIRMRTEMKPRSIEGVVYLKNNLDMISKLDVFSTSTLNRVITLEVLY